MKEKYLVILAIMVIGTALAVGFVFWSNRNLPAETLAKKQKAENPCLGLSADPGEISCEEAKSIALQKYPGTVQKAELATITDYEGKDRGNPQKIFKKVWLFDIILVTPLTFSEEKVVKTAPHIKVGVDIIEGKPILQGILWQ